MPMIPTKRRVGRPSKLTDAKAEKFIELIKLGVQRRDAAAMIGVVSDTIYHWIREGVKEAELAEKSGKDVPPERTAMVEFSAAYTQARAEYSIGLLSAANTCALAGEGKMLQFLMKADKPDVYGDRQHITADVSTNVVTLYPTTGDSTNTTLVLPEGDL